MASLQQVHPRTSALLDDDEAAAGSANVAGVPNGPLPADAVLSPIDDLAPSRPAAVNRHSVEHTSEARVTINFLSNAILEDPEGGLSLPSTSSTPASSADRFAQDGFRFEEVPANHLADLGISTTMLGLSPLGHPYDSAPDQANHHLQPQGRSTPPAGAVPTAPELVQPAPPLLLATRGQTHGDGGARGHGNRTTPVLRTGHARHLQAVNASAGGVQIGTVSAPNPSSVTITLNPPQLASGGAHGSNSGAIALDDEVGAYSRLPSMPMASVMDRLGRGRWLWVGELQVHDLGDFRWGYGGKRPAPMRGLQVGLGG